MRGCAAIFFLMLAVVSCDGERVSSVFNTDVEGWQRAAIFELPSEDSLSRYDLTLFLRYHPAMVERDTLQLNVVTTTPSELRVAEQIVVVIDHDDKAPKRSTKIIEVPYREAVQWQERGEYRVAIYPKERSLGIEAVGLIVIPKI